MAAHLSDRKRSHPRPGQQALVALLITSALAAPAWSWVVIESPDSARSAIALVGGVSALLLCAAVAVATHQAAVARNARDHATRVGAGARTLEEETGWVVDVLVPSIAHAVREDRSVQNALSEHPRPTHPTVERLAHAVTTRVGETEQRATRDRRARAEMEEQIATLADATIPHMLSRIRQDRTMAEEVLAQEFREVHPPVAHLRGRMLDELLAGDRRAATAMISAADSGARIQAHLTTLLAQLRELEERYGDRSDIFSDLLEVDHNVSRTGRLADAFVTLAHGRSGRRWTRPIIMESILRGAMGRITAYRRVRLHYTSTVAVVGYAAEGVMQALAELMDNAANFSAQGTDVHVYVQEEDTGVTITVEDSGVGMRHRERRIAESLLTEPRDLSTLPSGRIGLAVVGYLADKYGLKVSLRPSARGGIGVVVLIPPNLITEPRRPRPRLRSTEQQPPAPVETSGGPSPRSVQDRPAQSRPTQSRLMQNPSAEGRPAHGGPTVGRPVENVPAHDPRVESGSAQSTNTGPRPSLPRRNGTRTDERSAAPTTDHPLPQRRRGLTLAQAVRENPEQLFPTRPAPADGHARGELPGRFSAFRDAGDAAEDGTDDEGRLS